MTPNLNNGNALKSQSLQAVPRFKYDGLRPAIKAELEEIRKALQNFRFIDEHPSVELISKWHDQFIEQITTKNHFDLEVVKEKFTEMLVEIVVPVELFHHQPVHIIQLISKKLSDSHSIFYSKPYAENANKVIAETKKIVETQKDIPENVLKQLREVEARKKIELEKETKLKAKIEQLRERFQKVQDQKVNLDAKMNSVGQLVLQKVEEQKEKVKAQDHEFNEKNAAILKKVEVLKNAAEEIRDAVPLLNKEIELSAQELQKLKASTVQLQKDVEQTRKDIEESKGGWLTQVLCIAASVAVSIILERPVIITPNSVSVGIQ